MNDTRPTASLATLEEMLGTPVTIRTKAGQLIDGTLAGYDEHLNLTLEAGPTTDDHDTDDEPRLIRGNRVVAITHPPIEREAADDEPGPAPDSDDEHNSPTRAADASDTKPSPSLAALKNQLDPKNLTVDIGTEGETLVVTKLGQTTASTPMAPTKAMDSTGSISNSCSPGDWEDDPLHANELVQRPLLVQFHV